MATVWRGVLGNETSTHVIDIFDLVGCWVFEIRVKPGRGVRTAVGRIGAGILVAQSPFSCLLSAVASIERGLPRHE